MSNKAAEVGVYSALGSNSPGGVMKHTAAFKLQCMEFSTDINNEKIDLCFYEDGHKVSDFSLTQDEAITLAKELVKSIAKQCGCRELAFTAYKIKSRNRTT